MPLLEALAEAFIRTFGITEPSPQLRRRAAWFIVGLLSLVFLALCAVAAVAFHFIHA